ncbi:MAG: high-affinity nickel-transport family protein [Gemmatimonadaceae bacterium]
MHGLTVALIASLLLGMRHATDADHIVAVSTIVNGKQKLWRSSRIGVMWGLGHTLTIFIVGGSIVLFRIAFTPRLGLSMEFCVALMLMVLGYLNLTSRAPVTDGVPQVRPFLVGAVHGMAGSAAATLLIIPLIDDPRWAALYLGVFGIGTIAGMALVTLAIAAPAMYAGERLAGLHRGIRVASGVVSLAFGVYLGYKVGFVDGLFTADPYWNPL